MVVKRRSAKLKRAVVKRDSRRRHGFIKVSASPQLTRGKKRWISEYKPLTELEKYGAIGKPLRILIVGETGSGKTHNLIKFLNARFEAHGRSAFITILFSQSAATDKTWQEWGGFKKYVDIHSEQYDETMATALPDMLKKAIKKGKRPIIIFDDKGYDQKTNSTSSSNHVRYIATAANQNQTDLIMLYQRPQYMLGDMVSNAQYILILNMDPRADRELAARKFLGKFPMKRALAIIDNNIRAEHDYLLIDSTGPRRVYSNAHGPVNLPEATAQAVVEKYT